MTEDINKDQIQLSARDQNVGVNVEMTTEQVINAVAARPSWKMALLWIGLMSFMAVGKKL